jgi:hypothetical protein
VVELGVVDVILEEAATRRCSGGDIVAQWWRL